WALGEAGLGAVEAGGKRTVQPRRDAAIRQVNRAQPEHAARRRLSSRPQLSQPLAPAFELPAGAQPRKLGAKPLQPLGAAAQEAWQCLAQAGAAPTQPLPPPPNPPRPLPSPP